MSDLNHTQYHAEPRMKNWLNPADATALLERLDGLQPDSRPRWGRLTASAVVCHLADPIRVVLGEKQAAPMSGPFRLPGLAHAIVWLLPWPKSAPTTPDFLPGSGMTPPGEFESDKRTLFELMNRFSAMPADRPVPPTRHSDR